MKFDVNVPADLDQLRRDNSHGAVIGRKGLVKLRHHAADGGRLLHKMNVKSGIGQIQSSLHPGDSSANHHRSTYFIILHFLLLSQKMI